MPKHDDSIEFSGEDNVYEVEKIVGVHRPQGKTPLYRVRWKGYGPEEDTFEPRDHLLTCEDMIDDFLANEKQSPAKEDGSKPDKKKPVKRRHSGDSSSPPEPSTKKEERESSPGSAGNSSKGRVVDDDDSEIDPRALLKDTFWDDLETGAIVPNLFENDMYSKVKSRRATLEAKKKKQEEPDKPTKSSPESDKSKSSPPTTKGSAVDRKKKETPSPDVEEGKKAKKKRHSSSGGGEQPHDSSKKKKKKKDHKSKKKRRRVKMDLEAIGSLESATQKSLRMSPSDLDGSDNSANLFISAKPAEEVLTVAKLEEQSRLSSSNASPSSDVGEEKDSPDKLKDQAPPDIGKDNSGQLLSPNLSEDTPNDMSFLGADIENILEKDPFSMNEDTDSEAVSANLSPKVFQSISDDVSSLTEKDDALVDFEQGPSLWDQLAKDLPLPPASSTDSDTSQSITFTSSLQAATNVISDAHEAATSLVDNKGESKTKATTDFQLGHLTKVKEESSGSIVGPVSIKEERLSPDPLGEPVTKQEQMDGKDDSIQTESVIKEKEGSTTVVKQEPLSVPQIAGEHQASVLDTVLQSENLEPTEELPNLTGNLFDNFMPLNSPFTDDEQRLSGSEEPRVDVGRLLSELEDNEEAQNKEKPMDTSPPEVSETPSAIREESKEVNHSESEASKHSAESSKGIIDENKENTSGSKTTIASEVSIASPGSNRQPSKSSEGQDDVESADCLETDSRSSEKQVQGETSTDESIIQNKQMRDEFSDKDGRDMNKDQTENLDKTSAVDVGQKDGINMEQSEDISDVQKNIEAGQQEDSLKGLGDGKAAEGMEMVKDIEKPQNDVGEASLKGKEPEESNKESVGNVLAEGLDKVVEEAPGKPGDKVPEESSVSSAPLEEVRQEEEASKLAPSNEADTISAPKKGDTNEATKPNKGDKLTESLDSSITKPKTRTTRRQSKERSSKNDSEAPSKKGQESESKSGAKPTVTKKGKKPAKTLPMEEPPAKKPLRSTEKGKEAAKKVTNETQKEEKGAIEEKNSKNDVKAAEKESAKSKAKETSKKPAAKMKKKITEGSWKFDCINEIPRNDENTMPLEDLDKNETWNEDYLCKAITEGNLGVVNAILHHRPNLKVDRPNSRGQWPIVLACMGGHNQILKKLIMSKAQVDVRLSNGVTPLMIAAEKGFTSATGILLEAGASVNLANSSGETALIKATRKGHLDIVQLLLHYGADWGQTSIENTSAMSLAKQHKMYMVSDLLQKHEEKLVEQLEYGISKYMWGTAKLVHAVLPSRCFRIRESTQHHIKFNFDPSKIPFSATLGTMLFLCHVSPGSTGMTCHLTGPCHVKEVTLNGTRTNPVPEGNGFVMEFIPRAGPNNLSITTHSDPYTKMLLLVAAYSLQITPS